MRSDLLIAEVIAKCDVLKRAGIWPSESVLRTRAWLQNFEETDRNIAAFLLDKFTFYNKELTDALFVSSYHSIGDGLPKGPAAPSGEQLIKSLASAVFTPVRGENPNPTDSGYFLCRMARQLLAVPESMIVETSKALEHACNGGTVVFIDDFIGSGDQFLHTWNFKDVSNTSFKSVAQSEKGFVAIYLTLVATDFGLEKINSDAPNVAVCMTHIIEQKSTIKGLIIENPSMKDAIEAFLTKYASRLCPKESYMLNNNYLVYGYKERGLLFGFEHSIPDATLPIFWAPGINKWESLIERK